MMYNPEEVASKVRKLKNLIDNGQFVEKTNVREVLEKEHSLFFLSH